MLTTISLERLDQIENERAQTFNDPSFIKWMKRFKVSRMASNPNAMEQTRRIMEEYNYSNYKFPSVKE
jgi:hypothetical protein